MSRIVNKCFTLERIVTKFHYNAKNVSIKSNLLSKSSSPEEKCVNVEQCRNDPCPPMLHADKKEFADGSTWKEPECKIESVLGSPVKQMYDAKVIIIGAGVAGLAAGQYLQNAGVHNYTILEALERPGGRIHSLWLGDSVIEMGSRWGTGNPPVNPVMNMPIKEKYVKSSLFNHDPSRGLFVRSCGRMINYPLSLTVFFKFKKIWEEAYCLYKVERVMNFKSIIEYVSSRIQQEVKIFSHCQCYDAARIFYGLANMALYRSGVDDYLISEDNFANYIDLPEGLFRVPLGYVGILTPYLHDIPQEKIKYCSPVVNIRWSTVTNIDCPRAMVVCADGQAYYADYVLITIPLGVLKSTADTLFCPRLPSRKINAISKVSYGHLDKLYLEYDLPLWAWGERNKRISWDINDMGERCGWLKGIRRLSPLEGSEYVLAVTVAGPEAVTMVSNTKDDIAAEITEFLREGLCYPCLPQPVRIKHSNWATNPYFCGGYTYLEKCADPSLITDLAAPVPGLGEPVEPILFFAGEATSPTHYGTDHGGRISGIREAVRILQTASCREGKACSENPDVCFS